MNRSPKPISSGIKLGRLHRCPACGYEKDAVAHVDLERVAQPKEPEPGSIDICANCGQVGQYNETGGVDPMSEEEIFALPLQTFSTVQEVRTAVKKAAVLRSLRRLYTPGKDQ